MSEKAYKFLWDKVAKNYKPLWEPETQTQLLIGTWDVLIITHRLLNFFPQGRFLKFREVESV